MASQWNVLTAAMLRPALPPPRLTADVYETAGGEAFVLEIPVPGLKPEEILIEADAQSLTVSTRPQPADSESDRRYLEREHPVRAMSRVFEFPSDIDPDNIRATLEHGILKVRVPKAASSRRRTIKVA